MHQFTSSGPADLRLDLQAGRVRILGDAEGTASVELRAVRGDAETQAQIDRADVHQSGDRIVVSVPSDRRLFGWLTGGEGIEAIVHLPARSAVQVRVGSATVDLAGSLGEAAIRSGSGAIRVEDVRKAEILVGSGRIEVGNVDGDCLIRSASGRVEIGHIGGDCRITSGSGAVSVTRVTGALSVSSASGAMKITAPGPDVDLTAASGAIAVECIESGKLRARTASGKIRVGVAEGVAAWVDVNTVSGALRSELEAADAPSVDAPRVELRLNTVSGGVDLRRAAARTLAA